MDMDGYAVCGALIADSLERCRHSDIVCRVTIRIKSTASVKACDIPSFLVSVSDTGPGISHNGLLTCFQALESVRPVQLDRLPLVWAGDITVLTTDVTEEVVRQYRVQIRFCKPKVMQLQSVLKEGGGYRGSNVTVELKGFPDQLLRYVLEMCKKVGMLMMKNVGIEVAFSNEAPGGKLAEDVFLFMDGLSLQCNVPHVERLRHGLSKYILDDPTSSLGSFDGNSLMIGRGVAESCRTTGEIIWSFATCFAVMGEAARDSCLQLKRLKTRILFFQDFMCAKMTDTVAAVLRNRIDWARFGLNIKDISIDYFGDVTIDWGNVPGIGRIEILMHKYHNDRVKANIWPREGTLLRKSVEGALHQLKEKYPRVYLSNHALEIQKHVPYLSKCITMLISSSSDVAFKTTCADLLGLKSTEFSVLEPEVRERILHSIEIYDRRSTQPTSQED